MDISKAKEQIIKTARAYLATDENGIYLIEHRSQRPVLLMGSPGIGKTAIAEQAAAELGICFLSYSMTHHTRQSALGLPMIEERDFGGVRHHVTEYTMSEIIASVHETMESTGLSQGILFLDEINCVSETLTPVMLQFLQYKVFGKHSLPEGWVLVCAGNPPEFNRSARTFDVVTLDRLKVIDIEPDYKAWRDYAISTETHPAVVGFLDSHGDRFYEITATETGTSFATARGWSDLAGMISVSEDQDIAVDIDLISQYIRNPAAASEFYSYYELYRKYSETYNIGDILAGRWDADIIAKARDAAFDERWSILSMLIRRVSRDMKQCCEDEDVLKAERESLKSISENAADMTADEIHSSMEEIAEKIAERSERDRLRGLLSASNARGYIRAEKFFRSASAECRNFDEVRIGYNSEIEKSREKAAETSAALGNLFGFTEEAWPDGTEILLLVTDLTAGRYSSRFIARHGCEAYYRNADRLNYSDRRESIAREIDEILNEPYSGQTAL